MLATGVNAPMGVRQALMRTIDAASMTSPTAMTSVSVTLKLVRSPWRRHYLLQQLLLRHLLLQLYLLQLPQPQPRVLQAQAVAMLAMDVSVRMGVPPPQTRIIGAVSIINRTEISASHKQDANFEIYRRLKYDIVWAFFEFGSSQSQH